MGRPHESTLKHVLGSVPAGFYVDTAWLERNGVSRQLAHKYVAAGWLERVGRGVFRRPLPAGARDHYWTLPVLSAQRLMKYDLHVGGPTALALTGHAHAIRLGAQEVVYLYAQKAPLWLNKVNPHVEFRLRKPKLFDDQHLGLELFAQLRSTGGSPPWHWSLDVSSPERAILETIDELPETVSFSALDLMFENLGQLRPRLLTTLLKHCRRVKVKRLFFVYADKHQHGWRAHVDPTGVDLGAGDRAFTAGGRLHPTYRITVPAELLPSREGQSDGP